MNIMAVDPHYHSKPTTLFFFFLLFAWAKAEKSSSSVFHVKVGVVLDLETWVGKLGWTSLNLALSDFNAYHPNPKTRIVLHLRQSPRTDVVAAAAAAMELINDVEAEAIIGPQDSMQANFIIQLGNKSHVPIITFSATSPALSSLHNPYFFRATNNDYTQAKPISAIVNHFGWREVVLIYVDNAFGQGIVPYLTDALQQVNTRISYRSAIPESATDNQIAEKLKNLMDMRTRVFILHMAPNYLGCKVFAKAKEIGMMREGYVWIITDGMTNPLSEINPSDIDSMQGVLGLKSYIPQSSTKFKSFSARWKRKFHQDYPEIDHDAELDLFGAWAHDAIFALAMAAEKVGFNVSHKAVDLHTTRRVSQNGPRLAQALSNTRFRGITGDFQFIKGQLQVSAYQIINIHGRDFNEVGFWTPKHGLTTNTQAMSSHCSRNDTLGSIIWPGNSCVIPKGWEFPTNGKRLRIGVPVKKAGFKEFVCVDNSTKKQTGYSINVFQAAIQALPYEVPHDFIPFTNSHGEMAGTYNDLVDQVFLGKYDAVVGDITIEANRSWFVDFTLPYTESGITMVVPIRDRKQKNAWMFLKPFTLDLWVTSACFFVFIGFVVWVLEHRINHHFRGPPSYQVGTSLWFAFSTMVFAQRERVFSNLSRVVVIIWCFLVLILTQSYTASLTSLLTVQQLQPTVTDVNQLLKNGANVGYLNGSFVEGILKGWKFNGSKLRIYNSADELEEMFSNGSIAAAVDEKPYVKLFLAKYCNKYTTMELPFKTNGFGFVFPKGSPLVPEVSRAILNVTESDKINGIENKWIEKGRSCPDPKSVVASNSLGLESLWGLFLIAGMAAISALALFTATFLFQHRHEWSRLDPQNPMWTRICSIARIFDQKDLSSLHVSRKTEDDDKNADNTCITGGVSFEVSPSSSYPTHLSSPSPDMNSSILIIPENQRTPSPDLSAPASPDHAITNSSC